MTDATASFAGNDLRCAEWGIDIATAGMQKCMGGPAGISPSSSRPRPLRPWSRASPSRRALPTPRGRPARREAHSLQLLRLPAARRLLGPAPHQPPHRGHAHALRRARDPAPHLRGGHRRDIERHRLNGAVTAAGVAGMGLELYGDQSTRMNDVIGIVIPEGATDAVRAALLENYAVEIASSFGPLKGHIWRVGVMGCNARKDCIMTTLLALARPCSMPAYRWTSRPASPPPRPSTQRSGHQHKSTTQKGAGHRWPALY